MNKKKKHIFLRILLYFFLFVATLLIAGLIYFASIAYLKIPVTDNIQSTKLIRKNISETFYTLGNNKCRKSDSGIWELYIEGNAFDRGVITGKLTKELIYKQEKAFVEQINKIIPSKKYLSFLKYFIAWFNRDIDKYIPKEYLLEIYGISLSASNQFSYIAPNYQRMVNYHAAHDIGHALQDYKMVGCTSFSAWRNKTEDSSLIIGRNFDFYVGDEFAKEKIVCFVKPDKGYKFMFITWGGMIGVVSGMNEKGLTVTINAAKSEIPFEAATPISIVAREILQYAKNINEAYEIAKKRQTFVSESIMIGSAEDNKTSIIEKSPYKIGLYSNDSNYIICTNHYNGDTFKNDKLNIENINTTASFYRFNRVQQIINKYDKINVNNTAEILRNQYGIDDKNIGTSNEKAVNQLIAHHSIIFNATKKIVWISTSPYQLGQYIAYDLNKVFQNMPVLEKDTEIYEKQLIVPADTFLTSNNYKQFLNYKKLKEIIKQNINSKVNHKLSINTLNDFLKSNPEYYYTYSLLGDYYKKNKDYNKAITVYNIALHKEISNKNDLIYIRENIIDCYTNLFSNK